VLPTLTHSSKVVEEALPLTLSPVVSLAASLPRIPKAAHEAPPAEKVAGRVLPLMMATKGYLLHLHLHLHLHLLILEHLVLSVLTLASVRRGAI
jgi:hypothetical protein